MKKKLMMIAVLLGALSLGACVDDNETQSVTDVRNAKAEQLKARAELNNAAAQATKIAADAEVALMNAKAKAQQALAKQAEAEVLEIQKRNELIELQKAAQEITNEEQAIENQMKQLEVEQALRDLEIVKAQAQKDLADVAAQLEALDAYYAAALAQAQADLLNAQKAIVEYEAQIAAGASAAEKAEALAKVQALNSAATMYGVAVDNLLTAQNNLTQAKKELVELESGLADWYVTKEEDIAYYNRQIEYYKSYIEAYKQYTNYTEDVTALKNKEAELSAKEGLLKDDYMNKLVAYNAIEVDNTELNAERDTLYNNPFYLYLESGELYREYNENGWWSAQGVWNLDYWYYQYGSNYTVYDSFFSDIYASGGFSAWGKKYDVVNGEINDYFYEGDSLVIGVNQPGVQVDLRTVELRVNEMIAGMTAEKKAMSDALAKYKANYNGTATGYYAYAGAVETPYAADAAKKLNACDSTAAAKALYEADKDDYTLKNNYQNALDVETWLKGEIEYLEEQIHSLDNNLLVVNNFWAFYSKFDENLAALQKEVDAYNELGVTTYAEKVAAKKEYMLAYWAWQAVSEEFTLVYNVLYGYNGLTSAEQIDEAIKRFEGYIKNYEKIIADYSAVENKEQLIELKKLEIEKREVELKAAELAEADAKADLDALLAEEAE